MKLRNPYLTAILAVAGCRCTGLPPAPTPPPYTPDASYVAGDGAGESDCAKACDVLTATCGPQGAACAAVYQLIENRQEVLKPDGGALTCKDVVSATSKAAVQALGVWCP